jgi:hypothetical protein
LASPWADYIWPTGHARLVWHEPDPSWAERALAQHDTKILQTMPGWHTGLKLRPRHDTLGITRAVSPIGLSCRTSLKHDFFPKIQTYIRFRTRVHKFRLHQNYISNKSSQIQIYINWQVLHRTTLDLHQISIKSSLIQILDTITQTQLRTDWVTDTNHQFRFAIVAYSSYSYFESASRSSCGFWRIDDQQLNT